MKKDGKKMGAKRYNTLVDAIPDFFRSVLAERGLLIRELCLRTGKRSQDEMAFQLSIFLSHHFFVSNPQIDHVMFSVTSQ